MEILFNFIVKMKILKMKITNNLIIQYILTKNNL